MANLVDKAVLSDTFLKYKNPVVLVGFVTACIGCAIVGDFVMSHLLAHPTQNFKVFISVVFVSIFVSWVIHDIKSKQEMLKNMLPYYMKKAEDEDEDSLETGKMIEDIMTQLDWCVSMRSMLFLLNLLLGGYIALCVSSAILANVT